MWIALLAQISLASVLGAYTTCYSELLGLNTTWNITVQFEPLEDSWLAGTSVNPSYYNAWVTYDTLQIKESLSDLPASHFKVALKRIVLHELFHVELWELAELAEEIQEERGLRLEEQLITRIVRRPLWAPYCRLK